MIRRRREADVPSDLAGDLIWRYHLTRERVPDGHGGTTLYYSIREVYFAADGEIESWTREPIKATGDTWDECVEDLRRIHRTIGDQVLDLTVDPPTLVDPHPSRDDG